MILLKLSYNEYAESDMYWEFQPFDLNKINLLVGENAIGKSRVLNSIVGFSRLFYSNVYFEIPKRIKSLNIFISSIENYL